MSRFIGKQKEKWWENINYDFLKQKLDSLKIECDEEEKNKCIKRVLLETRLDI